jgi:hypothetical protein
MFADPFLFAGPMLEARENGLFVHMQQPAFQVDAHPFSQESANLLGVESRRSELIRNFVRNHFMRGAE